MLSKEQLDLFNRVLTVRFGLLKDGMSLFRLIWTTDQTEVLKGEHDIITESGVWLRREYGPRRVLKYPLIPDRYALEMFTVAPPELPEFPYTYEGVYFFQDKDGNYLEPIELAICYVARRKLLSFNHKPLSEAAIQAVSDEEAQRAEDYFFEVLDNAAPHLPTKMSIGEAVVVPGPKEKVL